MQRCPGCMRPLKDSTSCATCGRPAQFLQAAPFLPLRTLLAQGRFGVGCAVEQNGDGITYIGYDEQARTPVYIREFFPEAISLREQGALIQAVMQGCENVWHDCAQNFMEIWRKLQRLRGLSALLAVTEVFEENGTIYAVYEYTDSITLREFLLRGKLGYISWERARALLMPVLSTLGSLHQQGIIHRGISPNTLYFGTDGKVRIGGFSIWQARTAHGELTAELTAGYAALEQYGLDGLQGAWTDIYAFGAVLYRSLVGSDPDDAVSRRHNDRVMVPAHSAERIPAYVINALINAMQVFPEDRTRSVEHLRAELSASPVAVAHSRPQVAQNTLPRIPQTAAPAPVNKDHKHKKHRKKASGGALAVKTAAIILGAGILAASVFTFVFYRERMTDLAGILFDRSPPTTVALTTARPEQFEVPFLEGRQFTDDLEKEFEGKLQFNVEYTPDHNRPVGRIIRQSIRAGTRVDINSAITLTVSEGRVLVELPEIVGRNITEVLAELEGLDFDITTTVVTNDGTQEADTVRSVHPREGGNYPKGERIFIQVWGGVDGDEDEGDE